LKAQQGKPLFALAIARICYYLSTQLTIPLARFLHGRELEIAMELALSFKLFTDQIEFDFQGWIKSKLKILSLSVRISNLPGKYHRKLVAQKNNEDNMKDNIKTETAAQTNSHFVAQA